MNVDNIYTWLAVVAATIALGKQVYDAVKNRNKTKLEIEEALDKQPLVREQLELGNWGEAIKHLNSIIQQQADHVDRQDKHIRAQDEKIRHLEARNEALEAESEAWERKTSQVEVKCDELEAEVIRLRRMLGIPPHGI